MAIISVINFDTSLLVVTHALLEEVGLALQRDHVHPLEGVLDIVVLGYSEGDQESISDEFNILAH